MDLKMVFSIQDKATAKIKQITRQMEKMNAAMERMDATSNRVVNNLNRVTGAMNRQQAQVNRVTTNIIHSTTVINQNSNTVNNNTNIINRNTNARNTLIGAVGRESSALRGLGASLVSVAGLYAAAQGASKAFQATIGAAARNEQSEVVIKAMFDDNNASSKYLKMVDTMAIDSPLLNSGQMFEHSGSLISLTKDLDLLGKSWGVVEKLMAKNPMQGVEGAVYALRELASGDTVSIVDRFNFSKKDINPLKKLDFDEQVEELDKVLARLNITDKVVGGMGSTTLGYWNQLVERAEVFGREIGREPNTKLNKALAGIVNSLDEGKLKNLAVTIGDSLGDVVEKVISVGKWMWKWREPIAWAVGALAAVGSAFVGFGIIAALANPISLIAAGIAGAAVGMKGLYDNSETFRGIIDGIIGKAKELWSVFKADGVGGIVDMLFGAGTFEAVAAKFEEIKTFITSKIAEMQPSFERLKGVFSSVWSTISSVFSTVWNNVLKPGLASFWDALQILGNVAVVVFNNVIAPGLKFAAALFSTLWAVAGPVLSLLGAAVRVTFAVLKNVWDTVLLPLTNFILTAVKNAFTIFTDAVNIVGGAFDWVGGIIDTVASKISGFVDTIKNVKLPDWVTKGVNATVNFASKFMGAKPDGSHFNGLTRVPFNGYLAELHKGERVLTRFEADQYDNTMRGVADVSYEQASAGIVNHNTTNTYNTVTGKQGSGQSTQSQRSISIAKLAEQIIVREDADIDRIADGIVAKLIAAEAAGV